MIRTQPGVVGGVGQLAGQLISGNGNQNNSGAVNDGNVPEPYGNTNRGLFASWFNGKGIAYEDFMRQMQQMKYGNDFEASEAQKQRDWSSAEAQKQRDYDERMASTAYQRVIADMKKAGINPIMAFQNGLSASSAHGAAASGGSSARARGSNYKGFVSDTSGFLGFVSSLASIFAGLYTNGATNATRLATANTYANAKTAGWQEVYTKTKGGYIKTRR